jgi:hypothetical protein
MTYLRRYSLASICGLYQDDDDGEAARHDNAAATVAAAPKVDALATEKQREDLKLFLGGSPAEIAKVKAGLVAFKVTLDTVTQKQAATIITRTKELSQ